MLRELNTFVVVAQEGTFAAAGQKIGLTQAAVSAQMQRLETELGITLFDRSGRAAKLNRQGQQLLPEIQALLRQFQQLGNKPQAPALKPQLTLGAIVSIQRTLLPQVLLRFHRHNTRFRTRVVPGMSFDLINQVDADELDLAVVIKPPFSLANELTWTPLLQEPYQLLVPRQLANASPTELMSQQPFIRYEHTSFGGRQVDRYLREQGIDVNEICEIDELDTLVTLVAKGLGVALVPQTLSWRRWPAAVTALDLGEQRFYRQLGLVHKADKAQAEVLAELKQHFVAEVKKAAPADTDTA